MAAPRVVWQLLPDTSFAVLIVDKTVPTNTYREHLGPVWVLNHYKYRDPRLGRLLRADADYVGFGPRPGHQFDIRPVPHTARRYDLVYLADTYGVFTADFFGEGTRGERSRLIYGGLQTEDLDALRPALASRTTLIAEFNTLADPTGDSARGRLSEILGLTWSGWAGRYYDNLDRDGEIPQWLVVGWERQSGRPWSFHGSGFALTHRDGRLVVLADGELVPGALRLELPDSVARRFGTSRREVYQYWFDVVTPETGTRVLAEYRLPVTDRGRRVLDSAGIPERFPAMLQRDDGPSRRYYFAGDWADYPDVPRVVRAFGWARARRLWAIVEGGDARFFWAFYVPLLRSIVAEQVSRVAPPAAGAGNPITEPTRPNP